VWGRVVRLLLQEDFRGTNNETQAALQTQHTFYVHDMMAGFACTIGKEVPRSDRAVAMQTSTGRDFIFERNGLKTLSFFFHMVDDALRFDENVQKY
jgi:hypothetical protein